MSDEQSYPAAPPRQLLLRALQLDPYKTSRAREVSALIERLLAELRSVAAKQKLHDAKYRLALEIIVLNLFIAWWHDQHAPCVHYSRDRNTYTGNRVGCDVFLQAVEWLVELGYVHQWIDADGEFQARLLATPKLIARWDTLRLSMIESVALIELRGRKQRRIGRDGKTKKMKGRPVRLPLDRTDLIEVVEQYRKNLATINTRISQSFVGLLIPDHEFTTLNAKLAGAKANLEDDEEDVQTRRSPVDLTRKYYRRVINNVVASSYELDMGGRFVGPFWQSIPRSYRSRIWINDELGVERDFWAMEISVLYGLRGLNVSSQMDDPYVLDSLGWAFRDITKRMLLIIINNENSHAAAGAIKEYVENELGGKLPDDFPTIPEIVRAFEQKHSAIMPFYGKDDGMRRMFIESRIAERVMMTMNDIGVPVLAIHDSFIVPASEYDRLGNVMRSSFKAIVGQDCEVTTDYPTIPFDTPRTVDPAEYQGYFRLRDEWPSGDRQTWKRDGDRKRTAVQQLECKHEAAVAALDNDDRATADELWDEYTVVFQGLHGEPRHRRKRSA